MSGMGHAQEQQDDAECDENDLMEGAQGRPSIGPARLCPLRSICNAYVLVRRYRPDDGDRAGVDPGAVIACSEIRDEVFPSDRTDQAMASALPAENWTAFG